MLYNERGERHGQALDIAKKMMVAARTAPKGKGIDAIEVAVVDGPQIGELAGEMRRVAEERGHKFFLRDALCVEASECVLLVGTADKPLGLNCGHCGFERCADRLPGVPCAINSVDVASRSAPPAPRRPTTGPTRGCCSRPALLRSASGFWGRAARCSRCR